MHSDERETNKQAIDDTTDGEQSTATAAAYNALMSDSNGTPPTHTNLAVVESEVKEEISQDKETEPEIANESEAAREQETESLANTNKTLSTMLRKSHRLK
mmetsp:Transcript_64169/g.75207  ORF Transcript_64169/g.75207 Transcript_64169/m.75207 type:complete len:101 (+) Transcript_64169:228-530(+)